MSIMYICQKLNWSVEWYSHQDRWHSVQGSIQKKTIKIFLNYEECKDSHSRTPEWDSSESQMPGHCAVMLLHYL